MAGDTASYTCISGYEVDGDSVLTCRVGDVWSPNTPDICQGGSIYVMIENNTPLVNSYS